MNGGLIGLLLIGLALGAASVACWRFMLHPLARVLPALLSLSYYVAMWAWPHQAITAFRRSTPYPGEDSARLMLLGLALALAIAELIVRLQRATTNNAQLRRELDRLRGES